MKLLNYCIEATKMTRFFRSYLNVILTISMVVSEELLYFRSINCFHALKDKELSLIR